MKLALMICGQPRFYETGFQFLSKNIIEPNLAAGHSLDIFLHCWHDPAKVEQEFDGAPWNVGQTDRIRIETPSELIRLYNPKQALFQPQLSRTELQMFEHDYIPAPGRSKSNPYALFSQYYSMKRVNQLRVDVEELENTQPYDIAIRTRFDFGLKNQIIVGEEHRVENCVFTHDQLRNHTHRAAPEPLFFGSRRVMNLLCGTRAIPGLYGNLNHFWMGGSLLSAEDYFAKQIDSCNIRQNLLSFDYELIRG